MPTTEIKENLNEVLFNEGEGLEHGDLNNIQRYMKVAIQDHMFGEMARDFMGAPLIGGSTETVVFVPHVNNAFPVSGVMTITNTEGTVCQWVDEQDPNGEEPMFLACHLENDDLLFTLDDNTSGNPRIDGVYIKLSHDEGGAEDRDFEDAITSAVTTVSTNKKYQIKLESQVVTGTAAATPALPSTPAGYAVYCYVAVPTGSTLAGLTAITTAQISDMRMPFRIKSSYIPAYQAAITVGTPTVDATIGAQLTPADALRFFFPGGADARIIAVDVITSSYSGSASLACSLARFDAAGGTSNVLWSTGFGDNTLHTLTASNFGNYVTGFFNDTTFGGSGGRGPAVWGNGYANGAPLHYDHLLNKQGTLIVNLTCSVNNLTVTGVRFWYA